MVNVIFLIVVIMILTTALNFVTMSILILWDNKYGGQSFRKLGKSDWKEAGQDAIWVTVMTAPLILGAYFVLGIGAVIIPSFIPIIFTLIMATEL